MANTAEIPPAHDFDFNAARALPDAIRFGSSTWTYPGWKGLVYFEQYKNEKEFKAKSLSEYVKFPWFRTVGIDSTYYSPPSPAMLENYAAQVPAGFQWVSKVWERLTVPKWPSHPRYGKLAGSDNPDFFNPKLFRQQVLEPYTRPAVAPHTGPFVFQMPPLDGKLFPIERILESLESFFSQVPSDFRYAVEVRNREYLTPDYFSFLNRFNLTHCFNHWYLMPALREQMEAAALAGGLKANFFVARLLTPRGINYEKAVGMFKPYDVIKRPNPEMRGDAAQMILRIIRRNDEGFILVNNRSEGNAPATIDVIGRLVQERLAAPTQQRA